MTNRHLVKIGVIPFTRDFTTLSQDNHLPTLASNLFEAALLMSESILGCELIQYCWEFLEPPLFPYQQIITTRVASICREINKMSSSDHIPCKIWDKSWLNSDRSDRKVACILPGRQGWSLNKDFFSRDKHHLSSYGYKCWLFCILNSSILQMPENDTSATPYSDDFIDIRPVFNVLSTPKNYFVERYEAKKKYVSNTADFNALTAYKGYRNFTIDCSDLIKKIFQRYDPPKIQYKRKNPF